MTSGSASRVTPKGAHMDVRLWRRSRGLVEPEPTVQGVRQFRISRCVAKWC